MFPLSSVEAMFVFTPIIGSLILLGYAFRYRKPKSLRWTLIAFLVFVIPTVLFAAFNPFFDHGWDILSAAQGTLFFISPIFMLLYCISILYEKSEESGWMAIIYSAALTFSISFGFIIAFSGGWNELLGIVLVVISYYAFLIISFIGLISKIVEYRDADEDRLQRGD